MHFQTFQARLIAAIRMRVRTGEFTERRLARLIGISQPHIHNVLKGVRELSPGVADRILRELKTSLLDLVEQPELAALLSAATPREPRYREVQMLEGRLGPGRQFPQDLSPVEFYPFLSSLLYPLVRPVVVRLGGDVHMGSAVAEDDLVLLDQADGKRMEIEPDTLYAVSRDGEGLIRWVRQGTRCIYLVTADSFLIPAQWEQVPSGGWHLLEVVKAKVVWIGRETGRAVRPPA